MKNILIIKHGSLGDIVLSIYPIFSIKEKYKNSKVTILTEAKYQDLFKSIGLSCASRITAADQAFIGVSQAHCDASVLKEISIGNN